MSVEDLLDHIRKQTRYHDDDDGEPGRAAGQQLHEHKVHVLGVEEGPVGRRGHKGYTLETVKYKSDLIF